MPDSHDRHARTGLRLLTFGGLSLVDSTGAVVGQQRRRLALLALLAAAREQGMSRDHLVAFLSPESPTESARHALQQLVYYLRQQGGEDVFLGTDPLRLNPLVITSDLDEFEGALDRGDCAQAAALYRGPFLDGFHLDSAEFEQWVAVERSRLAVRYSDALCRLAQASQTAGNHAATIEWWRQLATVDPLSARNALGLMRSLVAAGDTPCALRHARVHQALVRAELGGSPDPEVAAFAARLQASERDALPAERMPVTATAADPSLAGVPSEREPNELAPELPSGMRPPEIAPRTRRDLRLALLAGVSVVVLGAALLMFRAVREARGHTGPVYRRTAIAVLPFQNLSVEPSRAYFAGGLYDELLTQLSKVADLQLTSRQSVMGYAGTNTPPLRQIARELEVGSVVEGSVQVVGNRLRVTVQLIDATTDAHLWGEHYDRTLDDAFAIQSDVARQIVAAVGAALSDAETRALAAAHTTNAEAYRLYLQGREYFTRKFGLSPEDLDIAQHFYERALTLDPSFALAHAALSQLHGLEYIVRYDRSPTRAARQHEEAEAALRLAPDLPQAHLAMGSWHYQARGDYPRALAELRIAVAGLPNDAEVWARIGQVTRRMGNWNESARAHEKTTQLDLRNAGLFKELGVTYMFMHRYSDAVIAYDRALSLAPDIRFPQLLKGLTYVYWQGQLDTLRAVLRSTAWSPTAGDWTWHALDLLYWDRQVDSMVQISKTARAGVFEGQTFFVPASLYAAWAHQLRGDRAAARGAFDLARVFLDSAITEHPDDERMHAARGLALAGLGRREEALREARWLQQSAAYREDKFQGGVVVEARARILAQIGDADAAVDEIESLLTRPSQLSVHTLRLDPSWDAIRTHARFRALFAKYTAR